jgi:hypothetical protein
MRVQRYPQVMELLANHTKKSRVIDTTTQMQDGKCVVIAHGPTDNVHTAQATLAITARKRDEALPLRAVERVRPLSSRRSTQSLKGGQLFYGQQNGHLSMRDACPPGSGFAVCVPFCPRRRLPTRSSAWTPPTQCTIRISSLIGSSSKCIRHRRIGECDPSDRHAGARLGRLIRLAARATINACK